METISLSQKEVPRAGLLKAALAGKITNAEGAHALGLTVRQFQRLKARFALGGARALAHRSRGKPSPRRLSESTRQAALKLIQARYPDLNDCHLTEKLAEVESLPLSRSTVRRLRKSLDRKARRPRKPAVHRQRRLREAREGSMVLTDGSEHDWLQGRGPQMALMCTVDDATGAFLSGTFRPHEDLHGYATIFHRMFLKYGLPLTIYGDGTGVLVRNDQHWSLEEELAGERFPTHLGGVLKDLGITYIQARSAQAKGRIENRWGTVQDRLPAELRLRGINDPRAAEAYLPEFLDDLNMRFARPPRDNNPVWRKAPADLDLIISCRYFRSVARDNTVSLCRPQRIDRQSNPGGLCVGASPPSVTTCIQIPPGPGRRSYAGRRVEVRELLDGRIVVLYQGRRIAQVVAPDEPFALIPRADKGRRAANRLSARGILKPPVKTKPRLTRGGAKPAADHPWRDRNLALKPGG